ncbi:transposase [bacterium]|nr:transposase [bacterium]
MVFDPRIHHRRSIRLAGYDYTANGAYFVTMCSYGRECLFGGITDSSMILNDAGRMVKAVWDGIPSHYSGVEADAFIIMPNHVHAIIVLVGTVPLNRSVGVAPCGYPFEDRNLPVGAAPCGCPDDDLPEVMGNHGGIAPTGSALSLPDIVHRFKTMTTKRYADGMKLMGWPPFHGRLWQRNYYEHIIRDETEWNRIREYIETNPARWEMDRENPDGNI